MNKLYNFYTKLPFNKAADSEIQKTIRRDIEWRDLKNALNHSKSAAEFGCGNGWFSNRVAYHYPDLNVLGIDLINENIQIANKNKVNNANFKVADFLSDTTTADTIITIGVLHHIDSDLETLMEQVVQRANKYCFIGLYHDISRRAMFDYFDQFDEIEKYNVFKKMTPFIKDETQRRSWYVDQFEHPYETTASTDLYKKVQKTTNTNLKFCNNVEDVHIYENTMFRLEAGEFVSGFIYGLFSYK